VSRRKTVTAPTRTARQVLVWANWTLDPAHPAGGTHDPIPLPERPDRVWSLFDALDRAEPPRLPLAPAQAVNALSEDISHDWLWADGTLRYFSRSMDRSCWVLLEWEAA
jgi:hypothetical protein